MSSDNKANESNETATKKKSFFNLKSLYGAAMVCLFTIYPILYGLFPSDSLGPSARALIPLQIGTILLLIWIGIKYWQHERKEKGRYVSPAIFSVSMICLFFLFPIVSYFYPGVSGPSTQAAIPLFIGLLIYLIWIIVTVVLIFRNNKPADRDVRNYHFNEMAYTAIPTVAGWVLSLSIDRTVTSVIPYIFLMAPTIFNVARWIAVSREVLFADGKQSISALGERASRIDEDIERLNSALAPLDRIIFGSVTVTDKSVITHRDTYLFPLSVASVRRPMLVPGVLLGSACLLGILAFNDLMFTSEILFLLVAGSLLLAVGWKIGQLSLLSMTLRGSELSGAVFGAYPALNVIRFEIGQKLEAFENRKDTDDVNQ